MIVIVLLSIMRLSCAALPMMHNVMDPQMIAIDDVEGLLYDVPEYEDPLLIQHQLSSIGAMPIFTLLESAKKRGHSKIDDLPEKIEIEESKKVIDEVMGRLESARAKLEKGNGKIYTDIEKAIQSLKALEKSARPDIRQVLSSLQSIMMPRPIMMPEIKEIITTIEPESFESAEVIEKPKSIMMPWPIMMPEIKEIITTIEPESFESAEVIEKPKSFDRQALGVRVISDNKPKSYEKSELKNSYSSVQSMSAEKSLEDRLAGERLKLSESLEISKESYGETKPPFEFKIKEKKNTNFDGEDMMASYKAKLTWKAAGIA